MPILVVKSPPVMKYLFFICLLLTLAGCNETPKTPEKPEVKKGKYFFDFDEVVYYSTDISEHELYEMSIKQNPTHKQKLFLNLILGATPSKVTDTTFLSYIDTVGYNKVKIPIEKHAAIREIFKQNNDSLQVVTSCTRFFRDIYVFKKKGKMTGVAELCYTCGDEYFIGAAVSTDGFGNNNEYKKLREIVSSKP